MVESNFLFFKARGWEEDGDGEKDSGRDTAGGKENDNEVSAKGRLKMVTIGVVCLCED